jgi:uncharacterized repeat protein (TIGR03803 family)
LYSFTDGNDGANPQAALVQGNDGYFYGTTSAGGENGYGTVFKMSASGELTSLYSFGSVQDTNGLPQDGSGPNGLVQGSDGYFYGTTQYGGAYTVPFGLGYGTVFRISTNGVLTSLYSFGAQDTNGVILDSTYPAGGLVQGSDGYFYGTTSGTRRSSGTVFSISSNGVLTTLYRFTGGNDGANPRAALVQGSDGDFYGMTSAGGENGYGTVFKMSASGMFTVLCSFDAASPSPYSWVQGNDGCFYGITLVSFGLPIPGPFWGPILKISTNGTLTILSNSGGGDDGAVPNSAMVQGSDGSFYGTTVNGGPGTGTIFRLTIVPEFRALTLTNGTLNLTWSTEAGGIYQLQSSASLATPNWTNLGSPATATNGITSFTDSVTIAPQRFYRVSLAQ